MLAASPTSTKRFLCMITLTLECYGWVALALPMHADVSWDRKSPEQAPSTLAEPVPPKSNISFLTPPGPFGARVYRNRRFRHRLARIVPLRLPPM